MPSTSHPQKDDKVVGGEAVAGKRSPGRKIKQFKRCAQPPRPKDWALSRPLSLQKMRRFRTKKRYLVPASEIARACQGTLQEMKPGPGLDHFVEFRMEPLAIAALQGAAEAHVVNMFSSANEAKIQAGRDTLQMKDIMATRKIFAMFEGLKRSFQTSG
ncbi:hypothetical protein ACHAPT_000945 [Fusarium lateritium]